MFHKFGTTSYKFHSVCVPVLWQLIRERYVSSLFKFDAACDNLYFIKFYKYRANN